MIEVNIKLSDGTTVTLTLEQAKELHEKLGQVFVSKDAAPALPWTMPFVQPSPNWVGWPPYATYTGTTGVATYLLNPCASSEV